MKSLLCILDWGLGHASRSLALSEQLRAAGEETILASSGRALAFLRETLPGEVIHELPAYAVRYPTANMPLNIAWQLPRLLRVVFREHGRTAKLAEELKVDRVISDSRFGCYVPGLPSVLLTHQLHPILGFRPASWSYRRYLQRFDEIWVPDHPGSPLSGRLSSNEDYQQVRYLGPLSRLQPQDPTPEKWRTLSLLSGPEPMRTRLEKELLKQLASLPGPHLLIQGIPGPAETTVRDNIVVQSFADATFLARHLPAAEYLICRAGYSTLMDLDHLRINAKRIFIPTPGQTEQEYLARMQVQSDGGHVCFPQSAIQLEHVIL